MLFFILHPSDFILRNDTEVSVMRSIAWCWLGAVAAVGLMVLCLWSWQHAADFVDDASRPYVAKWAARSAAIAFGAAAQGLLLTLVVGRLYRRQLVDDVLKLSAALVFAVAVVSAVAMGLASR